VKNPRVLRLGKATTALDITTERRGVEGCAWETFGWEELLEYCASVEYDQVECLL
jgi:hypothetical protein